jgi:hypothetical protein
MELFSSLTLSLYLIGAAGGLAAVTYALKSVPEVVDRCRRMVREDRAEQSLYS